MERVRSLIDHINSVTEEDECKCAIFSGFLVVNGKDWLNSPSRTGNSPLGLELVLILSHRIRKHLGDDLSPIERRVKERLAFYEPGKEIPLDDVEALVQLKREVVGRMAQLDPHPFWIEQRDRIISESILTPRGQEYKISTLTKKLEELGGDNGSNSHFFRKLKKIRENFILFGRFD